VEFYGEGVRELGLAGRITLCSMVTEMAGIIGFVPEFGDSLKTDIENLSGAEFSPYKADEDCFYSHTVEIDVSGLSPQVAVPFSPNNVLDVAELKGVKIDSGFIGSCTNGRTEDLALASQVLKGKKIKDGVTLKIVPATKRVYQEILERGILEDLFRSGAIISNPGCGGCAEGHLGLTGEGEVQISTGNRNFEGKQGKGKTYLASPMVVAASCLTGQITNPKEI
jgi:3-isopropylmalate/(R)-2-methylmalate dehydratase large subunit